MSKYFFIGIAGSGMSALAQYLVGKGHIVCGSDRQFSINSQSNTQQLLEKEGIKCFAQGQTTPSKDTDYVVVSTAIEETVHEYAEAKKENIKIIHRSDLLAQIASQNKTIAVCGTSGKSTTTAMIFTILQQCGLSPSLISGAGLVSLQKQGKIGNAAVGKSNILVIETDESDGTIVKYHPEIGIILNIDKDHKEINDLLPLFKTFANNTKELLIVNQDNIRSASFSKNIKFDFSCQNNNAAGNKATDFQQTINGISFCSNNTQFKLKIIGHHNMENAMAAISVARYLNLNDTEISNALSHYEGIYRRNDIIFNHNGIMVIDDFAHNPAKIAAIITTCQPLCNRVLAWFQPHGFAPSKLIKNDLIETLNKILRPNDEIYFSKIYYAGGTANKTICASEFSDQLSKLGKKAYYLENRNDFSNKIKQIAKQGDIILLMGARDPTLSDFAHTVSDNLK